MSGIRWQYLDSSGTLRDTPWFPCGTEIRWTKRDRFEVWHPAENQLYGFSDVQRLVGQHGGGISGSQIR